MSRYIDADELWLQLDKRESFEQGRNRAYYKGLRDAKKLLANAPTIEERHKGHWVVDEDGNIECSECGYSGVGDNYCERCGADMRRDKND